MGRTTSIDWCDATTNFWVGCEKVSPGCKFCYMYRDFTTRYNRDPRKVVKTTPATFNQPLKWKDPLFVFPNSLSDFFIEDADQWRDEAWAVINRTPQHTYLILTKRIERVAQCLPAGWGKGWDNVWIGFSAEDQHHFDLRRHWLRKFEAVVKWVSIEPLLAPIRNLNLEGIDWAVIGGESGNDNGAWRYRECEVEWISDIVSQCKQQDVPAFVKQLGTHLYHKMELSHRHGNLPAEWPEEIRVRDYPIVNGSQRSILF